MVKLLKLLLTYKFRMTKPAQKNSGFTLIELLVGLVIAFLIITPLLGFVVNMLQTDRQEQAKATSEQEIQAALDYIARDVEQAVHIYDGYGLSQIQSSLPTDTNSTPVLVFWKRKFVPRAIPIGSQRDDGYVYSLVAYYIRNVGKANCANETTYSCTAQITRVELRDAVRDKNDNPISNPDGGNRNNASPGFKRFDPRNETSKEVAMNKWPLSAFSAASGNINDNDPEVLIDYIDQTPLPAGSGWCPPVQRKTSPIPGVNASAINATYSLNKYQQVPITPQVYGFVACVDAENVSATVTIRGNALARTRRKTEPPPFISNKKSVSSYFPTASIQVKGNGVFSINQRS